jgi:hypothetical protein
VASVDFALTYPLTFQPLYLRYRDVVVSVDTGGLYFTTFYPVDDSVTVDAQDFLELLAT